METHKQKLNTATVLKLLEIQYKRSEVFPVFNEAANHEKLWARDVNLRTFLTLR
jgi:hypothetical protein